MLYLWVKALHVISVIAWMAGMLYLPRLYVYHADAKPGSELSETLKVMERKLLRLIINPAMIATVVFGAWMLMLNPSLLHQLLSCMQKLGLVFLHDGRARDAASKCRRAFAKDRQHRILVARFYRISSMRFRPLLILAIVILVIVITRKRSGP